MAKKCKFEYKEGKKVFCKTHNQSLLYAYVVDGEIHLICQVGEDEILSEIEHDSAEQSWKA